MNESEEKYRPVSQSEIKSIRENNLRRLRLSDLMVFHENCNHFYLAKQNGKKLKQIENNEGPGYCSVCWKIKKTYTEKREETLNFVDNYQINFENKPQKWTANLIKLEKNYYSWLYS